MKIRITILTVILLFSKIITACSCGYYELDFFKNVRYYVSSGVPVYPLHGVFVSLQDSLFCPDTVITGQTGYFVLIDTIGTGNSGLNVGDTVVINGQDGFNCGEGINSIFLAGDTAILALIDRGCTNRTYYIEGACGIHYLKMKKGMNNGLELDEIRNKLSSILSGIKIELSKSGIEIYPNPSHGNFTISHAAGMSGRALITNIKGNSVFSVDLTSGENTVIILPPSIEDGVYLIRIETQEVNITERIVIQRE